MDNTLLNYLPKYFYQKAFTSCVMVLVAVSLIFFHRILPLRWILSDLLAIILFFYLSFRFTKHWRYLSVSAYTSKLLRTSLVIRIIWVLFSYVFFQIETGKPFEYQTADAYGYYQEAAWLSGLLTDHKWDVYLAYIGKNYGDMGYPTYLGLIYYLIGDSILIPRIIKAILGAYTCLFIYKLTRNNFGESTGRIAGIMAMLVPNLIYYCGLHVKETEMVFLTVGFVYYADTLIRSGRLTLRHLLLLSLFWASLFFFRTVLAGCLVGSFALATVLTSSRVTTLLNRTVLYILVAIGVLLIANSPVMDNINENLKSSDKNLQSQMRNFSTRADGSNRLASYGSKSIFLPLMLIAPFPTLVYISDQPAAMMMGGAFFTRNVYAFFVLVALIMLYKRRQLREHVLVISVIFSYIFVLASSGFALSERFHLPLIPFLMVMAAHGISQMNQKNTRYFIPYLVVISAIIIGWNWFKLAGRT